MKKLQLLVPEVSFDDDCADVPAILTRRLHINQQSIKTESAGGIDSWGNMPNIPTPETKCLCGHIQEDHGWSGCLHKGNYARPFCPCLNFVPENKEVHIVEGKSNISCDPMREWLHDYRQATAPNGWLQSWRRTAQIEALEKKLNLLKKEEK